MKTLLALPILAILLAATPAFAAGPANISTGQATSANWSGYAAAGNNTYTGAGGAWTVPASTSTTNSLSADAAWVGIGGVNSQNLIQLGTQSVVQNGSTTYQAWYEMLPDIEQILPVTVNAGDSITATLNSTGNNTWQLSFTDNTTHQNYTTTTTYNSDESSADWIEERPINGNNYLPLDNFGTTSFTNAYAIVNGVQESLLSAGAQPITMITANDQSLATPSALGSDGESFSVSRTNISSTIQPQNPSQNVQGGRGWHHQGNGMKVQNFTTGQGTSTQQIVTQMGTGTFTVIFGDSGKTYTFSF